MGAAGVPVTPQVASEVLSGLADGDLTASIDGLGRPKIAVVGHGGGLLAALLAREYPDPVSEAAVGKPGYVKDETWVWWSEVVRVLIEIGASR